LEQADKRLIIALEATQVISSKDGGTSMAKPLNHGLLKTYSVTQLPTSLYQGLTHERKTDYQECPRPK